MPTRSSRSAHSASQRPGQARPRRVAGSCITTPLRAGGFIHVTLTTALSDSTGLKFLPRVTGLLSVLRLFLRCSTQGEAERALPSIILGPPALRVRPWWG